MRLPLGIDPGEQMLVVQILHPAHRGGERAVVIATSRIFPTCPCSAASASIPSPCRGVCAGVVAPNDWFASA